MTDNKDLLNDLNDVVKRKPKHFYVLIALSLIFILFVLQDSVLSISFERLTLKLKTHQWKFGVTLLIPTIIDFIFTLNSKKAGWIISFLSYFGILLFSLWNLCKALTNGVFSKISTYNKLSFCFVILIAAIIIINLLAKSIRFYFQISNMVILSTGFAAVLFMFLLDFIFKLLTLF